jgi:cell division protein FtsB
MLTFLRTKIGTTVLLGLFFVVAFVTARQITQKYQIDKQIRQLQARADKISGQNQKLSDLVNYLGTDQYKEKAAREQLNLKKDGEFVVALPQNQQEQVSSAETAVQLSNPQKWYNYFFAKQ